MLDVSDKIRNLCKHASKFINIPQSDIPRKDEKIFAYTYFYWYVCANIFIQNFKPNCKFNNLSLNLCSYCRYLLILDRTNWRTKMQTSLLIPYIFLSLPSVLFYFLRWSFFAFSFFFFSPLSSALFSSFRELSENRFMQSQIQFTISEIYADDID